jgi:hypothetical protein
MMADFAAADERLRKGPQLNPESTLTRPVAQLS